MEQTTEAIMKLQHENDMLKDRCYALTYGTVCMFCTYTCAYRTAKYRGENEETNNGPSGID